MLKNDELPSPRETAAEGEPGPRTKEESSPEDEIAKERLENVEKRILRWKRQVIVQFAS